VVQIGETVVDAHGRTWKVTALQPIEMRSILGLLKRESCGLGGVVHIPTTQAELRLEGAK
jgi:hypothetical protein